MGVCHFQGGFGGYPQFNIFIQFCHNGFLPFSSYYSCNFPYYNKQLLTARHSRKNDRVFFWQFFCASVRSAAFNFCFLSFRLCVTRKYGINHMSRNSIFYYYGGIPQTPNRNASHPCNVSMLFQGYSFFRIIIIHQEVNRVYPGIHKDTSGIPQNP